MRESNSKDKRNKKKISVGTSFKLQNDNEKEAKHTKAVLFSHDINISNIN